MNREDIIAMAREAGFVGMDGEHGALRRFAALVAAAEREACAKVCDLRARSYSMETDMWAHEHVSEANICAAAIRTRGQA